MSCKGLGLKGLRLKVKAVTVPSKVSHFPAAT